MIKLQNLIINNYYLEQSHYQNLVKQFDWFYMKKIYDENLKKLVDI